ncbi:MAG: UDP-N-acetylglucosamine diphosphorylase/glucosamine-1-phosphate N-acetyltransferase [Candidatus Methylopumilus sp.]|nr:UDP-N-acetylglucosamine diphosphorylase/glucosamine-1-phosphate N-acetyltransferase [Candidatus Methylopumilus sp.]
MMSLSIVILAAGKGTRMRSDLPKVLQSLAHKPLLGYVIDAAVTFNPEPLIVVYGCGGDIVKKTFPSQKIQWVEQKEQLGTGHALQQTLPFIKDVGSTLILYGDVPLIDHTTIRKLIQKGQTHLAVLTFNKQDPTGYGRMIRESGKIKKIVEENDCDDLQKNIQEINTGIMCAPNALLKNWLSRLNNRNNQKEYYLTDIVRLSIEDNIEVLSESADNEVSITGINSKSELATMERNYQLMTAQKLMEQGVTIMDPARIDIRGELIAGKDVTIDIGCVFEGKVVLGNNVRVSAYSYIKDSVIGDSSMIEAYSHIVESQIGEHVRIGPFARLRPGTQLKNNVHIGNFVEIKNSQVNENTNINHLSYVGDSHVGKSVNIGAGTITCNYDGTNKHQTIIEDEVFIGSNTALVAPVKIGKGATIAAGSTITKDAPPGELTVSRDKQTSIAGWKKPTKK